MIERLASERSGLDKAIARLQAARATLDTIIDRRDPGSAAPTWHAPAPT
ncbi:hypothetical protein [Kribbella sp. NBC_00889]|nr:hypothetical protein OG817_25890 [Kribbella sp. NBC_00889]